MGTTYLKRNRKEEERETVGSDSNKIWAGGKEKEVWIDKS